MVKSRVIVLLVVLMKFNEFPLTSGGTAGIEFEGVKEEPWTVGDGLEARVKLTQNKKVRTKNSKRGGE